jgi:hypothetical protein
MAGRTMRTPWRRFTGAHRMWEEYRAQLADHPDAIAPPHQAIAEGRVRVAVAERFARQRTQTGDVCLDISCSLVAGGERTQGPRL